MHGCPREKISGVFRGLHLCYEGNPSTILDDNETL